MKTGSLICIFLIISVLSCNVSNDKVVHGDGKLKQELRTTTAFQQLEVSGTVPVLLAQGEFQPVKLEGDENLLPYIELVQNGDQLIIRNKKGYQIKDDNNSLKVTVTVPTLTYIKVSGASGLTGATKFISEKNLQVNLSGVGNLELETGTPELDASITGAGSLNLRGQTKKLVLDLSGVGNAACAGLQAEDATVNVSGTGNADIMVSGKLNARITGIGSIHYKGEPKTLNQEVSGMGSIKKME